MSLPNRPDKATAEPTSIFGGLVQQALISTETGNVPLFIVNGLGFAVSQTEITMMLNFSNRAVAAVVMAPAMAKTVGEALVQIISEYEKATGQIVKSFSEASLPEGTS